MKKVFGLVLGMLMFAGAALGGESIFNPASGFMEAPQVFQAMQQNKFAFKKNFAAKKILVGGAVDKVDEGTFELMDMKSPKMPEITLKGLFHAFLVEKQENIDLAEINPDDVFFGICSGFAEGAAGVFVKAKCQPVMIGRVINGQSTPIWVTSDKNALDFAFTPRAVEKLTKK